MKGNSSKAKSKRSLGGFTLVELIVVIAVLAILAGVGAVAYNGYIEYAKKGQDRATVGEIIHALELADYANPDLFGDNSGAMVVLSTSGINGAGGMSDSSTTVNGALEDAFGSLTSTTLNYDGWKGTANMGVFADLGKSGTQIESYISEGYSSSFADDMEEYWDVFDGFITGLNNGEFPDVFPTGLPANLKDNMVKTVVEYYATTGDAKKVKEAWEKQEGFAGSFGFGGRDLTIARNYAIVSYLKQQDLSAEMREELEQYEKTNQYNMINPIWTSDKFLNSSNNTEWNKLFGEYFSGNQDTADATAYLGLMEAAAKVEPTLEDEFTDDDFLDALSSYVGMVSNVLTGRTKLGDIQTLATGVTGSAIVVNATKKNGVLSITVSPEDADPRTGSSSDAPQEEVDYTKSGATLTFENGKGTSSVTGEIFMKSNETIEITVANISTDTTHTSNFDCRFEGLGVTSASATQTSQTVSITSGASGTTGTVVISWMPQIGKTAFTITITVIVK